MPEGAPVERTSGRIRPPAAVRSFPVDDGLLLLDADGSRLFAYNGTARHLWELIESGRAEEELVSEFVDAWRISRSRAHRDIASALTQWRGQGLLAADDASGVSTASAIDADTDCRRLKSCARWASEWICTFARTTVSLAIEDRSLVPIRLMLAHLETPGARPQARIEIRTAASGEAVLFSAGIERSRTHDRALLVGGLWQAIIELIHPDVAWLALIHGAAVARSGAGYVLCGPSGSGKSTLTAGLTSAGFDYLADDLVALSAPAGTIVRWPMPISVKPGSVDVITTHHPGVAQAPRYRTKGVEARLLVPPATAWDGPAARLRFLVFPRFRHDAAPQLRRISTFQAIERLLGDRVWIGHPITADRVAALLALLGRTPAYIATYGTLDDGMRLIGDLA